MFFALNPKFCGCSIVSISARVAVAQKFKLNCQPIIKFLTKRSKSPAEINLNDIYVVVYIRWFQNVKHFRLGKDSIEDLQEHSKNKFY